MSVDRLVVVVTRATVVKLQDREIYAARFRKLGLTTYGATPEEAMGKLKQMFNRFIHLHRDAGLLEDKLDRAGVEWSWASEYPGDYEDTNKPPPANAAMNEGDALLFAAA